MNDAEVVEAFLEDGSGAVGVGDEAATALEDVGTAFVVDLQASDGVRAPVVAITPGAAMRTGADATVDAADAPSSWLHLIRDLLG